MTTERVTITMAHLGGSGWRLEAKRADGTVLLFVEAPLAVAVGALATWAESWERSLTVSGRARHDYSRTGF